MSQPLVSVKMITYNHAPFIGRAIEGVLRQRADFPFELVIGEDCSTDGTRDIVFSYQKKFPKLIRVITSDRNVGMKKNGLRTFKACRGKYVAFCEGDDYWQSRDKLQKQAEYLEQHPKCGLVYSSYDVYHVKTGKRIPDFIGHKKWTMPERPSLLDFLGKSEVGYGILTCTVMLRTGLGAQVIDGDPFLHQSERFLMGDSQLWAELSTLADLHYLPESLATHIITEESATRSRDIRKVLRFRISCAEASLYLCDKYGVPADVRSAHEASWCEASLRLAYHSQNRELAEQVVRRKKTLNGAEWMKYLAARYRIVYAAHKAVSMVQNIVKKGRDEWD